MYRDIQSICKVIVTSKHITVYVCKRVYKAMIGVYEMYVVSVYASYVIQHMYTTIVYYTHYIGIIIIMQYNINNE